jgi:uncharacterized delta-60 repeat protein
LTRRRSRTTPPRRSRRPCVEALEGRALLTAGTLDPTFGAGAGYVKTDLGTNYDRAQAVAVEPWDGKLVVAENHKSDASLNSNLDFTLVRYNTDGSLDSTFGSGGIVKTDFNGGNDSINEIVFTPDQKIVAVGQAYVSKGKTTGEQIGVARYNANGTVDSTFGSGGKVTVAASTSFKYDSSNAGAAVLDSSGRLVIAGSYVGTNWGSIYTPPFYYGNALVRLNANGTLDSTFGNGGIVLGRSGQSTYDGWTALRLQPVGSSYKIDVVGTDQGKQALLQLNANGSRDGTFGSNGEVFLTGDGFGGSLVAFEPDGGFVGINQAQNFSFTVTRYDASGNIVFDHAVDYSALVPPGTYPAGFEPQAVAIDPSGRIVLGGGLMDSSYGPNSALMRLDSSGNLDATFGSGGLVVNHFGPYDDEITCLAFQADGSIITAGYIDDGGVDANGNLNEQKDVLVARYESD